MTIGRVKSGGYGANEVITSAQITAIDLNVVNALDRRAGFSDTLSSIVSLASGARVIPFIAAGADANVSQNYAAWATNAVYVSSLTASRTYQLLNGGGAIGGDSITFFMSALVNFEVAILNAAGNTLFTLGNLRSSDGAWCTIWFTGSVWALQTNPGSRLWSQTFLASGTTTWTCPSGVTQVFLVGCGQGGGGGGGQNGSGASSSSSFCAGSGGGGAHRSIFEAVAVTPGVAHSLTIGFSGGGAGSVGSAGSDGADTTFTGASITCRFPGGQGGTAGQGGSSGLYLAPSSGTHYTNAGTQSQFQTSQAVPIPAGPGGGGGGSSYIVGASRGNDGGSGYHWGQGGAGGGAAATSGAGPVYFPGGAGGGGGGGGYGTGGTGGSAGAANSAGTGFGAGAAGNASVNTGAGGGGGGSGGQGSGGGGAGTAGGSGGTGQLTIIWVK